MEANKAISYTSFKERLLKGEKIEFRKESFTISVGLNTERLIAIRTFPELEEAENLKYKDPERAFSIFTEVASKMPDGNIYPHHQRLFCLRQMKRYYEEREAVLDLIDIVKYGLANEWECFSEFTLQTYISRLGSLDNYFIPRLEKRMAKEAERLERMRKRELAKEAKEKNKK